MDIAKLSAGMELEQFVSVMTGLQSDCIREIDACGWLAQDQQLGIVFSEIPAELVFSVRLTVEHKMSDYLRDHLPASIGKKVETIFSCIPTIRTAPGMSWVQSGFLSGTVSSEAGKTTRRRSEAVHGYCRFHRCNPAVFPLLPRHTNSDQLTSPGPVFFMQERLGKFGKHFASSISLHEHHNDDAIHRQYIGNFMPTRVAAESDDKSGEVVIQDPQRPRVTHWVNSFAKAPR